MSKPNINVSVDATDEIYQELAENPDKTFALKLIQRDRVYDGCPTNAPKADFVFQVRKLPIVLTW